MSWESYFKIFWTTLCCIPSSSELLVEAATKGPPKLQELLPDDEVESTAPESGAAAMPPKQGTPNALADAAAVTPTLGGNAIRMVLPNDEDEAETGKQAEADD